MIVAAIIIFLDLGCTNMDPMQKTLRRIQSIQQMCGDLCDTSKEITPGDFMGSVTSKVVPSLNPHTPKHDHRLTASLCSSPQSFTSQGISHLRTGHSCHQNYNKCTPMVACTNKLQENTPFATRITTNVHLWWQV